MNVTQNEAPRATVLAVRGTRVTVRCPYCDGQHDHQVREDGPQHRAPGCGMTRSFSQRLTGYHFEPAPRRAA